MKKIFLSIVALFILTHCEPDFENSYAEIPVSTISKYGEYIYKEEIKRGMIYGVWYVDDAFSKLPYTVTYTNLTKDSLEIVLLKKQISLIK